MHRVKGRGGILAAARRTGTVSSWWLALMFRLEQG
jgi:hypothetical protein